MRRIVCSLNNLIHDEPLVIFKAGTIASIAPSAPSDFVVLNGVGGGSGCRVYSNVTKTA